MLVVRHVTTYKRVVVLLLLASSSFQVLHASKDSFHRPKLGEVFKLLLETAEKAESLLVTKVEAFAIAYYPIVKESVKNVVTVVNNTINSLDPEYCQQFFSSVGLVASDVLRDISYCQVNVTSVSLGRSIETAMEKADFLLDLARAELASCLLLNSGCNSKVYYTLGSEGVSLVAGLSTEFAAASRSHLELIFAQLRVCAGTALVKNLSVSGDELNVKARKCAGYN